jgi:DNA polymerase-3 subunit gamma/tau
MTSHVYYRKWRPQSLGEVVGQKPITDTLLSALRQQRVAQAYLFCGPRGTGKTSTGRILAKAVNCLTNEGTGEPCNTCSMCQAVTQGSAMDVIEIDAATFTQVDRIRELTERANYAPAEGRFKVYIIDEVHMLSTSASNALLKTLEEPPPRVIFILATTELHKILPTILSRCQRFDFRRLTTADVTDKLAEVAKAEGVDIDREGLTLLARAAGGSLRDAENLLQQTATVCQGTISLRQVQDSLGLTGDGRAGQLMQAIAEADAAAGIRLLAGVAADGVDLKQFNREVIEKLRQVLLVKAGTADSLNLTDEELLAAKTAAAAASMDYIMRALKGFISLAGNTDMTTPLAMEMALMDAVLPPAAPVAAAPASHSPVRPAEPRKPVSPPAAKPAAVKPDAEPAPVTTRAESPAPPQPVTPGPAPSPAAEPVSTLEELRNNWPNILGCAPPKLRRSSALAILRSAGVQPVSFTDGVVTLSFKFPIHMNKINEPENRRITAEILSACLGVPCEVSCLHEPPANHLVKEAQRRGAEIINVDNVEE